MLYNFTFLLQIKKSSLIVKTLRISIEDFLLPTIGDCKVLFSYSVLLLHDLWYNESVPRKQGKKKKGKCICFN